MRSFSQSDRLLEAMSAMEDHLANVVRNYWRAQAPAFAIEGDHKL